MTHQHATASLLATLVLAVAATACTGGDDDGALTTEPPGPTATTGTAPPTGAPTTSGSDVATTAAATSTPATTTSVAPTTTIDIEALKTQIAEDYLRTEQALEDLNRSPSMDGLELRAAEIAVPGSYVYSSILTFVEGMVARGERVAPGVPDYSDVIVESVEFVGDPVSGSAEVIACVITNQSLVGPDGAPISGSGAPLAARTRQPMQSTAEGWRQSSQATGLSIEEGATSCAPA